MLTCHVQRLVTLIKLICINDPPMQLAESICYNIDNNIATVIKYSLQLANEHNYNMLTQCMGNYHGECSATCRDHMMLHRVMT